MKPTRKVSKNDKKNRQEPNLDLTDSVATPKRKTHLTKTSHLQHQKQQKTKNHKIRANTNLCLKRFNKTAKKGTWGIRLGLGHAQADSTSEPSSLLLIQRLELKWPRKKKLVMFKGKPKFKPKTWLNWTNWWKTEEENGSKMPGLVWPDCTNYSCTSIRVEKTQVSYQCPPAGKS